VNDIDSLLERIERLESLDQIRQLPAKYALSIDMRDFDSLANLFVADVGVPGKLRGPKAEAMVRRGLQGPCYGFCTWRSWSYH